MTAARAPKAVKVRLDIDTTRFIEGMNQAARQARYLVGCRQPLPYRVTILPFDDDSDFPTAAIEAAVHAAGLDFAKTVGRNDGTRSAQVGAWAAEFERVALGRLSRKPKEAAA